MQFCNMETESTKIHCCSSFLYVHNVFNHTELWHTENNMSELILTCKHQKIQEAQQQHRPAIAYVTNECRYLSDS